MEPDNAVELLATVRERQGRVDEAIALLRTREITSANDRDQLADLLARHERVGEFREYAVSDPTGDTHDVSRSTWRNAETWRVRSLSAEAGGEGDRVLDALCTCMSNRGVRRRD
ncbi:hypothetical protein FSY75_09765 [Streptomyces sp. TR1341]|uniref:Uncharacterized protein n=1 Tax=Streptomyces murinus TaxID=33900 RepID=A0A7W3NWT5_STRMR|nr:MULTISPECIES: hypothetical protein [Streptomyces]MBA9058144.1 hypothetical protein [Streptomyces murinus]NDK24759.1 hypothetical protein [Streptomyces sp. TR1341]UWW92341.1 hypothetical protein GO605_16945 [Streptomyces murinus]